MSKRSKYNISEILMVMAFDDLSTKELSILMNKSKESVNFWRKSLGILPKSTKFTRGKHIEKEIIENYTIGWAVGVFATDGHLHLNKQIKDKIYKRVSLTVTLSDRDHLIEFFNSFLEDFNPEDIRIDTELKNTYATHPKVSYVCSCPNFINLIEKYIDFNKKTYDLKIKDCFENAPEEFKIGFLKGCIDGDGHVSNKHLAIDIVSASENFILTLQKYFGGMVSKRKSGNYWDIRFRMNECFDLIKRGLINKTDSTLKRKSEKIIKQYDRHMAEFSKEYVLIKNGQEFKFNDRIKFQKDNNLRSDRLLSVLNGEIVSHCGFRLP